MPPYRTFVKYVTSPVNRLRSRSITVPLIALFALIALFGLSCDQSKNLPLKDFTFVVTADVHYGAFPACRMWLESMIREINAMDPQPAFVINCGDLTELGSEAEMQGYNDSISQSAVPFYNSLGNHDAKWSDQGKGRFRDYYGPNYYAFDYGGIHFMALDVTVTLEQYAHVEKAQLAWLVEDLRTVGRERPIVLFMHHPIGRWKTYADNQYEVIKALGGYNVKLILQGHEHHEELWNENGITQVESDNLYGDRTTAGRYRIIRVHDGKMTIFSKRPTHPDLEPVAIVSITPTAGEPVVTINFDDPGTGNEFPFTANITSRDLTPSYIGNMITDDGVAWTGYYQFSLTAVAEDRILKVRANRNTRMLAVALQARDPYGTWQLVDWKARPPDDMLPPDNNHFWIDLKFNIPAATEGPFRLISFEPAQLEINAFRIWLLTEKGDLLDEIDVGDPASEQAHSVSVSGSTWSGQITSTYPTAVRYWIDLDYGGRRAMVDGGQGVWRALVDTSRLRAGNHTLKAQMFDDSGQVYTDYAEFLVRRGPAESVTLYSTGGGIQSSPTIANDTLFFGSNDGNVYAVNPQQGALRWQFQTGDQVMSSPVYANGIVYVGSADHKLYALDATTGEERWRYPTNGPIFGAPEVVNGIAYFGSGDHSLYAVNASTGQAVWSFPTENLIQMKPAYDDAVIYFGSWDNFVYALDASTGRQLWRTRIGSSIYYAPAQVSPRVIGDKVLVSAPTGFNYLLDKKTGAVIGAPFPSPASSFGYNDAWVNGNVAYVVSFGGLTIAYNMSQPQPVEVWRRALNSQVVNSGVTNLGAYLITGGLRGSFLSLLASTGELGPAYQLASQGFVFSAPYINSESMTTYLGALDGKIYATRVTP